MGSWEWSPERKQLRVLAALDEAKTQYYHLSAVLIAGMGFFTDAYDLFCISVLTRLLGRIYYPYISAPNEPGQLPISVLSAVNSMALCGALVGQIFCGWLGDKLGRKRVYGVTLIMMVIFSLASGLSLGKDPTSVMATLCFCRFWLGFGIGGDYPLSATIMSEYANTKTRGAFIAAVFAMQGTGILAAGAVGIILATIFDKAFPTQGNLTVPEADYLWRIMLMLGAFPALSTYYYRMKMPETARYTALVTGNAEKAVENMTKVLNLPESFLKESSDGESNLEQIFSESKTEAVVNVITTSHEKSYGLLSREFVRRHGFELLGTTSTWFLLDIIYFSQQLYQTYIFREIGWTPPPYHMNGVYEVYKLSRAQCLVALLATVPGYWVTVALVDRIGRRVIQLQGFLAMSALLFALAIHYDTLRDGQKEHTQIFIVLYSLTFFFANFGPNATTFIIPAELFPARLRSTCHGISAACGKGGSIVGTFGFVYAMQSTYLKGPYGYGIGLKNSLYILASIAILGALLTFLVPNTNNRSLERISQEKDFSCESDPSIHGAKPGEPVL